MLCELRIKNLAIIEDISLSFHNGLNVLTGETGAGKSIVIDALCLALGERASGELIRSGEKEVIVEAFFDIPSRFNSPARQLLEDLGIDIEEGVIMKRIITAQGKSRAYINDSMVNLQTLSEVSSSLIDVHGQYQHQSLLSTDNQLDLLDTYGGLLPEREKMAAHYESQLALHREIDALMLREKDREQRLDMLRYQVGEIEAAELKSGEEEELAEESRILDNAARLAELANIAYESMYSSEEACITRLSGIISSLREICHIDSRAKDALRNTEEALPLLEETAYFLRDYREQINFDPGRLNEVQSRLELIKALKRKYGDSIEKILEFKERIREELHGLENSEEKLSSLTKQLEEGKATLTERARRLSKKRKTISKKIEQQVMLTLSKLAMPDTKFSIHIMQEMGDDTTDGIKATSKGIDKVEFLIAPNIGEEMKPLSKIASGGELSRTMLALKGVMAKGDKIPSLIFDEIDAGIGGKAAETVGQRLKRLSSDHQTICVTHLPQIASYADTHLKIEKNIKQKRTAVSITKVEGQEREREIARMLSGDHSEVSVKHAREMLRKNTKL
ncbi:DNA repair protein RecN [bacterium]|nr:MAG: DNA repair protein RecN [bacterium]